MNLACNRSLKCDLRRTCGTLYNRCLQTSLVTQEPNSALDTVTGQRLPGQGVVGSLCTLLSDWWTWWDHVREGYLCNHLELRSLIAMIEVLMVFLLNTLVTNTKNYVKYHVPLGQYLPTGQGPPQVSPTPGSPLEHPPSHTNPAVHSFRVSSVVPALGQNFPVESGCSDAVFGKIFNCNHYHFRGLY